ncbi:MAG: thioredoxin family protein [Acidimicrobiales bacterium]|nr:thioredoxin family protein [Acidimicrobiales bacterium]
MSRLLVLIILSCAASLIAILLRKFNYRNFVTSGWSIPGHLIREDFGFLNDPWLVVIFSSESCETCKPVVAEGMKLASLGIAVQEVAAETNKGLHEKYDIDAVPMLLLVDKFGVVRSSHLGPINFDEVKKSIETVIFETKETN